MSDIWTLAGEAGKTINATVRSLDALRVQGLSIRLQAMATSTMSWTVWLADKDEINTYVPELRQKMKIYLNGDQFFHGWVVGRDPLMNAGRMGYRIVVADAWYFLANSMLSSEVLDGANETKERPVYLLPAGDISDHIQSVVSRAVALGMPVQAGPLADGFDVPRLSLQNQSIGTALADLMGWLADGVLWLDHTVEGHAAINMSRRATADEIIVEYGTAIVREIAMKPRVDLEVEEVKIATATRATVGNKRVTIFDEQTAGTRTSVLPTRGLTAITGPEINLTLPQDLTDSVDIEVAALTPTAAIQHAHDLIKQAGAPYPEVYGTGPVIEGSSFNFPLEPLLVITDTDGNDVGLEDWPLFLTKGEPRDWWTKDGIQYKTLRITCTVGTYITTGLAEAAPAEPRWATILGARYVAAGTTADHEGGPGWLYFWEASVSATVTAVRGLSNGTLIRSEDWGWFNPPEDLAENLLSAQSFMPWEGTVSTVQEVLAHGNPVGSKLNITGWVPECATMGALITGCTIVPRTGEVTYTCGPPMRHTFLDLVNRFRQSGSDNYYWLASPSDTGTGGGGGGGGEIPANATLTEAGDPELTEGGEYTLEEN